jgi:hypothetical protein
MGLACRDTSRGVGTTLHPLILWLFLSSMLITTTLLVLVSSDISLIILSSAFGFYVRRVSGLWGSIHLHMARRLTELSFYLIFTRVSLFLVRYF